MSSHAPLPEFDHRSVFKGTAYLMIGNITGQLIGLLGLLLLSRIYGPSGVGVWALFLGIGFMVPMLAGLRYDLAIVIVDKEQDARQLALLAISVAGVCATVALIGAILFYIANPGWIPPSWRVTFFAYAPYIFSNGFFNAATSWAIRQKHFLWLMLSRVGQPLITLILQYIFRDNTWFGNGLILGTVLGCVIAAIWSIFLLREPIAQIFKETTKKSLWFDLRALAWRERNFPFFSVPYTLLGNFANQAVVVALASWYSVTVAGFFNMAYRTLYAPLMLVGSALGQAIMPSLSATKREIHRFENVLTSILRVLGWIYLPPLVFIIFKGSEVYAFVFGESWAGAGHYAGYLTSALYGLALTIWLERIFDILGKQKLHLQLSFLLNGICVLLYAVAHFVFDNASITTIAWSFGMLLYAGTWLGVVFKICDFHLPRLLFIGAELLTLAIITCWLVSACLNLEQPLKQIAGLAAVFSGYGLLAWFKLRKDLNRLFQVDMQPISALSSLS